MASSSSSSSCSAKTPVVFLQEVLAGVNSGDSFAISTKEAKLCLEIAHSLAEILQQLSQSSKEICLQIIMKSKHEFNVLNDEHLWSK